MTKIGKDFEIKHYENIYGFDKRKRFGVKLNYFEIPAVARDFLKNKPKNKNV